MAKSDITHAVASIGGSALQLFYGLMERNLKVTGRRLQRGPNDRAASFVSDLRDLSEQANIAFSTYSDEDLLTCWSNLRENEEAFIFLLNTLAEFRLVYEFHYEEDGETFGYDALVTQMARSTSDFASSALLKKTDADILEKLPTMSKQLVLLKENNWLVGLQLLYLSMRAMDAMKVKMVFLAEEEEPDGQQGG